MSIRRDAAVEYVGIEDPDAAPGEPIHPGEILREEFLEPLGISAYALARAISVPRNRVTGILHGERAITADAALRLARFFGTSPDFWLGLQMDHDLETARATPGARLDHEVTPRADTSWYLTSGARRRCAYSPPTRLTTYVSAAHRR